MQRLRRRVVVVTIDNVPVQQLPLKQSNTRLYEYVKYVRGVAGTRNCLHIVSNIDSALANLFTG